MGNKVIDLVPAPQQTSACVYNTASDSLAAAHPCPVRYSCMIGLTMKCAYKTREYFLIAGSTHGYKKKKKRFFLGQLTPEGWKALGSMNKG